MFKHVLKTLVAAATISASAGCLADFYIGGAIGATSWDDGNDGVSLDILGGFQFSEFMAVEVAYSDLGSFDEMDQGDKFTTDITGANYSLVGLLPLADGIALKAKISYYDFELERSLNDRTVSTIQDGAVNYAVGLDINTMDNIYFSLEYRFIPIEYDQHFSDGGPPYHGEEEADNISLGVKLAF